MPDRAERRPDQVFPAHPWLDHPDDGALIEEQRFGAADRLEPDEQPGDPIDTDRGGRGIVDGRRKRADRDIRDLLETERRIPFEGALQPELHEALELLDQVAVDRKSTRLNSSHVKSSYAVFCLKKQK